MTDSTADLKTDRPMPRDAVAGEGATLRDVCPAMPSTAFATLPALPTAPQVCAVAEFTARERHEIHVAVDRLLAARDYAPHATQPYDYAALDRAAATGWWLQ